jgi:antitoxin MazE
MARTAKLSVQRWGNSLAVRIPAAVARSAGFTVGQPVEISVREDALVVSPSGPPRLSLTQKLALFNPDVHGGEAMPAAPLGREVL